MYFSHHERIWQDFPALVPGVLLARGITPDGSVTDQVGELTAIARSRLASDPESQMPEIQAWRRAFAAMGLKPTQYRCASEALLRHYRRQGSLPCLHPLVDLCNAVSVAFAIPVAAFDLSRITGNLQVRYATGGEEYVAFSGQVEHPGEGEVIFADDARRAHARRWTNRQSGYSAVRPTTTTVLIVAEAMHPSAPADVPKLTATLADALRAAWHTGPTTALLSPSSPRFDFDPLPQPEETGL
ncbi:MAG: B3/B4 domain-containing protein [Actinomycetes bacterium]